jgi:predicted site-specific integrase-resolvase
LEQRLLTTKEAAARLGIAYRTLHNWRKNDRAGVRAAVRSLPGCWLRWDPDALDRIGIDNSEVRSDG